jgi:hypothetical protein
MTFTASLRSELLKIKGTSLIYLLLITAFIIPFAQLFDYGSPDPAHPFNGWDQFYREGFMVFVFVFLPLFFVLGSTLLMQIEVRNHAWKQVLASPQSFIHILLAKFMVMQVLALAFLVTYNVYAAMSALVIDTIFDTDLLAYLHRWPELLKLNLKAYGSTLGISSLAFWLALRSKNFIAPIAIGFLLWLICPAALEVKWTHIDKYVVAIPFTIVSNKYAHEHLFHQLLSLGYSVFFFGIAYVEFVLQRTPLSSLWRKKTKVVSSNAALPPSA